MAASTVKIQTYQLMADMSQFHVLIIFFFTFIKIVPEIEDHLVGFTVLGSGSFCFGPRRFCIVFGDSRVFGFGLSFSLSCL